MGQLPLQYGNFYKSSHKIDNMGHFWFQNCPICYYILKIVPYACILTKIFPYVPKY